MVLFLLKSIHFVKIYTLTKSILEVRLGYFAPYFDYDFLPYLGILIGTSCLMVEILRF